MRVAVVGAGIAGLGAARALARAHHVEVFERDARAGRPRQHGGRWRGPAGATCTWTPASWSTTATTTRA